MKRKMNQVSVVLITCIVFLVIGCEGRTNTSIDAIKKGRIEAYFNALDHNADFWGVVLIGNHEEILYENTLGYSDYLNEKKHDIKSRFGIASLTKTFTSAAIIKLRDEGKLELSDNVSEYIPEFQHGDKITILNLLRHESGLSEVDHTREELYNISSSKLIEEIGSLPLLFEPGTNGRYSNSGFSVLAHIVERISGVSFVKYLSENFLKQLNINNIGDRRELEDESDLATPYFPGPPPELVTGLKNQNPSISLGSGSLYSSAEGLWKWGISVSQKNFVNFYAEDYPYGWGRDSVASYFTLNQTGMLNGYTSSLYVLSDTNLVVVTLSNIQNGLWVEFSKDLIKMYFDKDVKLPEKRKILSSKIDFEKASKLTGRYRLNDERYVDINYKDENLWLHLDGYYQGNYLAPISDNEFELRSFTGKIKFYDDKIVWKQPGAWGGNESIYMKE